jgi:hypothetical protein
MVLQRDQHQDSMKMLIMMTIIQVSFTGQIYHWPTTTADHRIDYGTAFAPVTPSYDFPPNILTLPTRDWKPEAAIHSRNSEVHTL